jgi:hypothetical protein
MKYTIALVLFLLLSGCNKPSDTYTLYRNSPLDFSMRIHMATFDAEDNVKNYNQENCEIVKEAMIDRPNITIRYWCEKGKFRE